MCLAAIARAARRTKDEQRRWLLAAAGAALVAAAAPAVAADSPATMPTRDVDIVYAARPPGVPADAPALQQRMRWSIAQGLMRLDPPSPDLYFVMDYRKHRLASIRPSQRAVVMMDATGAGIAPGTPSGSAFARKGEATVAGLACTEWETRDTTGTNAVACLTADGVLLRATAHGRTLIEAQSVRYGSIEPQVFAIPADYRMLTGPDPASPQASQP